MNIKELLNIAAETGKDLPLDKYGVMFSHEQLLRFADKLTAIEREACAKLCEEEMTDEIEDETYYICKDLAERIRAKNNE